MLWYGLYPKQKHLTWLLSEGIIHDRLRLSGLLHMHSVDSVELPLTLKRLVGEWSCICMYAHASKKTEYTFFVQTPAHETANPATDEKCSF